MENKELHRRQQELQSRHNKLNEAFQKVQTFKDSQICKFKEENVALEKALKQTQEDLKKERENSSKTFQQWQRANEEIAKLNKTTKSYWQMCENADEQHKTHFDMIKELKKEVEVLNQQCLMYQFRIKDVEQQLTQKFQEASEMHLKIEQCSSDNYLDMQKKIDLPEISIALKSIVQRIEENMEESTNNVDELLGDEDKPENASSTSKTNTQSDDTDESVDEKANTDVVEGTGHINDNPGK